MYIILFLNVWIFFQQKNKFNLPSPSHSNVETKKNINDQKKKYQILKLTLHYFVSEKISKCDVFKLSITWSLKQRIEQNCRLINTEIKLFLN